MFNVEHGPSCRRPPVPHADPSVYAKKYVGRYEHRNITGGIGHNLPQEAPEAFAKAIVDVNAFDRL
jgi:hypothetical protein